MTQTRKGWDEGKIFHKVFSRDVECYRFQVVSLRKLFYNQTSPHQYEESYPGQLKMKHFLIGDVKSKLFKKLNKNILNVFIFHFPLYCFL